MAVADTVEELQKNPYGLTNGKILQKMEQTCLDYFRGQKEPIKALQVQCAKRNVPEEPRSLQDLVPALFTHSSYKSYPEKWLRDGAWNKMNGWLSRLSVIKPQCDVANVKTLDNWLDALKTDRLQVTHSSGTTGKPSLFPRTAYEVEMFAKNLTQSLEDFFPLRTGEGVPAFVASFEEGYNVFVLGFGSVARAFGNPKDIHFLFPGKLSAEQARQGAIMKYKYARGELDPIETTQFEEKAQEQQQMMRQVFTRFLDNMVQYRDQKVFVGMGAAQAYAIAALGLKKGYDNLFSDESVMLTGGGLKGAKLPDNYMKQVLEFTGVPEHQWTDTFGMTECNSFAAQCPECHNRHIQPWLQPMIVNRDGTELLNSEGKITGRWGFIDPIARNYWGGIVTGDLVTVDFSGCDCGRQGAVIVGEIKRYTDLQGVDEDKLSCMAQLNDYLISDVSVNSSELEI